MPKHTYKEYVEIMKSEIGKQKKSEITAEDLKFYNDHKQEYRFFKREFINAIDVSKQQVLNAKANIQEQINQARKEKQEQINKIIPADFNDLKTKVDSTANERKKMQQYKNKLRSDFNNIVNEMAFERVNDNYKGNPKDVPFEDIERFLNAVDPDNLNPPTTFNGLRDEIIKRLWTKNAMPYIMAHDEYEKAVTKAYGHNGTHDTNTIIDDVKQAEEDAKRYDEINQQIETVKNLKDDELEGTYTFGRFTELYDSDTLQISVALEAINELEEKQNRREETTYAPIRKYLDIDEQINPQKFPEEVQHNLFEMYTDAKNAYDKLGWWDKNVWGKILPGKWSKASDIVNKKEAYEKVLMDSGFDQTDLETKAEEINSAKSGNSLDDFTVIEKGENDELIEKGTVKEIKTKLSAEETKDLGEATNFENKDVNKSKVINNNQLNLNNNLNGPKNDI